MSAQNVRVALCAGDNPGISRASDHSLVMFSAMPGTKGSWPSVLSLPCCGHTLLHIMAQHRKPVHFWKGPQLNVQFICRPSWNNLAMRTWSRLPSCCGLHRCGRWHRLPVYAIPPLKIHGVCGSRHICFGCSDTWSSLPQFPLGHRSQTVVSTLASSPVRAGTSFRPLPIREDHGVAFRFTFRKFTQA